MPYNFTTPDDQIVDPRILAILNQVAQLRQQRELAQDSKFAQLDFNRNLVKSQELKNKMSIAARDYEATVNQINSSNLADDVKQQQLVQAKDNYNKMMSGYQKQLNDTGFSTGGSNDPTSVTANIGEIGDYSGQVDPETQDFVTKDTYEGGGLEPTLIKKVIKGEFNNNDDRIKSFDYQQGGY